MPNLEKEIIMKHQKALIIFVLMVVVASCSSRKKVTDDYDLSDLTGLSTDSSELLVDDIVSENTQDIADQFADDQLMADSAYADNESMSAPVPISKTTFLTDDYGDYTVGKNETLMLISFKLSGDYNRWREIKRLNEGLLGGSSQLREGMVLKYQRPNEEFVYSASGNPYVIQRGDTLGTISTSTYGASRYWKNIWDNNRQLIQDPNLIFAGFTIYTPEIEGVSSRGVAFDDL